MKIGIIAPLEIRVPPIAYGGTEMVIHLLTEELVRRGHKVTLFASGDSLTSAKLVSVTPRYLRGTNRDSRILTTLNVMACLENADDFDLIHNHTMLEGMSAAGIIKTPMLTTLHCTLTDDELILFQNYKGWYNTVSQRAKLYLSPKEKFVGAIYNAIDVKSYPFNEGQRENFLLYFSRISPEKGPDIAIQVALKTGIPLVISGDLHCKDEQYFLDKILPHIDGRRIIFEPHPDNIRKRELLSTAKCLLAPVTFPEPFGLFMAEAMACGTPVIGFDIGAVPEVIAHGETGFVVNTVGDMAKAVRHVSRIDPHECRNRIKEMFDYPVMVSNYLRAYERIIGLEVQPRDQENEKVRVIQVESPSPE